jgi:hypothetical protein
MRGLTWWIALFVVVLSTGANAGISDDLVFCSKLKNGRERLACYDAAARIEKAEPKKLHVKSPVHVNDFETQQIIPADSPKSNFDGLYVAAIGGYGFASQDTSIPVFGFGFPSVPLQSTSGWNVGGAVGYNLTAGRLFFRCRGTRKIRFSRVVGQFSQPI